MRSKQWRKEQEHRVYKKHERKYQGMYIQKYPGKTPGKGCSNPACCGNPRRKGHHHKSELTLQEKKFFAANDDTEIQLQIDEEKYRLEMLEVPPNPWYGSVLCCTCHMCWPDYYGDYSGAGYFEPTGRFNSLDIELVTAKVA